MNGLIGYFLPALLVSISALIAIHVAREAPPGIKSGLALVGLSAWLVPWSLPGMLFDSRGVAGLAALRQDLAAVLDATVPAQLMPTWSWFAVLVPGLVWFASDVIVHCATIRRWRRTSHSGDSLWRHLPAGIERNSASIRIVRNSSVAAATGWRKPTIWIGDRIVNENELTIALTHEASHLSRGDPLRLLLIGFIARLHWFNPLVLALRRQAILAIEAGCDDVCASLLGRQTYRKALAKLVLEGQAPTAPAFSPALRSSRVDLLRLDLLTRKPRMNVRVWTGVVSVIAVCIGSAALGGAVSERPQSADLAAISDPSRYGYDVSPPWSRQ